MSAKNLFRAVCAGGAVLLVAGSVAPGAAAVVSAEDSGDVQVTVRKTVRQVGTPTGEITGSNLYMQVSAVGNGTRTVTVPVGTDSNRNLNSFGAFPMEGQSIVFNLDVNGNVEERTLTEAESYPMKISVRVTLDGQEITPADLVGKSGVVDVEYTVTNTTQKVEQITFTDVEGNEVTEDFDTAIPFAGSLDVVLPSGFNEVTAPGATVAGNGENGTQLGYTMVLFPPLGAAEVKVAYQSRVTNAVFPEAEFSFLPLIPFDNSTVAGTVEAYKGGAETGATIFGAGQQIGENLLKLQDGAGQLLAGLGQLSAGASQLSDGLVNTAAPGSAALADGANQVADGLDQLNSNVPALEEGVGDLNAGAQQLAGGNKSLSEGMAKLNAGIDTLSKGVVALPTHVQQTAGYQQLQAALKGVQDAIGSRPAGPVAEAKTLNEAITNLEFALDNPPPSEGGTCDISNPEATKCGFKQVLQELDTKLSGGKAGLTQITGLLGPTPASATLPFGGIQTGLTSVGALLGCPADPTQPCAKVYGPDADPLDPWVPDAVTGVKVNTLLKGMNQQTSVSINGINAIIGQIGSVSTPNTALYAIDKLIKGIGTPKDFPTTKNTLYYGLEAIRTGLTNPSCNLADPQNKSNPCGIKEIQGLVAAGINQLVAGISAELLKGIGTTPVNAATCSPTTLTCASAQLAAGSQQLAAGSEQLADGTEQLDEQVPTLASGVAQLDDGASQVADGADQLAAGLGAAADGSQQLADGLGQAEPGAAQIEDGAGQLKEQGSDELAKSGKEAQIGFARSVAQLESAQQMGVEGLGIPFGPAEGADTVTSAAYKVYLAGIAPDTENNAVKFGLGAALIAGAAGAAYAGMRRRAVA